MPGQQMDRAYSYHLQVKHRPQTQLKVTFLCSINSSVNRSKTISFLSGMPCSQSQSLCLGAKRCTEWNIETAMEDLLITTSVFNAAEKIQKTSHKWPAFISCSCHSCKILAPSWSPVYPLPPAGPAVHKAQTKAPPDLLCENLQW